MTTTPFALDLAHRAAARGLVGAHGTDPVVPEPQPAGTTRDRAPRTRLALAVALRRLADGIAPADHRTHSPA